MKDVQEAAKRIVGSGRHPEIADEMIVARYVQSLLADKSAEAEAAKLRAVVEAARAKFEHIIEYWNRSETDGAMSDALWHIIETAETALATMEVLQS